MRLAVPAGRWLAALVLVACAGPPPVDLASEPVACPEAWPDALPATDLVLAIDTSRSTRDPSGADIDGDGEVGEYRGATWTDRGDSLLAAQVAAVRRLVALAQGRDIRFGIVAYAGSHDRPLEDSMSRLVQRSDAVIGVPLTRDAARIEQELDRLLRRGSNGTSHFTPPMRLALRALAHPPDGAPAPRSRVLFLSDSPVPVRPVSGNRSRSGYNWQDARMRIAAMQARRAGVVYDTFGLGNASDAPTPHTLTHIAGATGGRFYAVPDPTRLHCSLLTALHDLVETADRREPAGR